MLDSRARLLGVELYFDDLERAKTFYGGILGPPLEEEVPRHHAKFTLGAAFLCAEAKGVEDYPSADKAVVFIEVPDLQGALTRIDPQAVVGSGRGVGTRAWAAIRDPAGHTVLLFEARHDR